MVTAITRKEIGMENTLLEMFTSEKSSRNFVRRYFFIVVKVTCRKKVCHFRSLSFLNLSELYIRPLCKYQLTFFLLFFLVYFYGWAVFYTNPYVRVGHFSLLNAFSLLVTCEIACYLLVIALLSIAYFSLSHYSSYSCHSIPTLSFLLLSCCSVLFLKWSHHSFQVTVHAPCWVLRYGVLIILIEFNKTELIWTNNFWNLKYRQLLSFETSQQIKNWTWMKFSKEYSKLLTLLTSKQTVPWDTVTIWVLAT